MPATPTVQERTMRVREVLMRAVQREISWIQAADILGISARNMRRWKVKFETAGLEGVLDRRTLGHPNPRRVTRAELERLVNILQDTAFVEISIRPLEMTAEELFVVTFREHIEP